MTSKSKKHQRGLVVYRIATIILSCCFATALSLFLYVDDYNSQAACCVRSMGADGEPSIESEPGFKGDLIECVFERDLKELIELG